MLQGEADERNEARKPHLSQGSQSCSTRQGWPPSLDTPLAEEMGRADGSLDVLGRWTHGKQEESGYG
jgi:hypothetical protein